MQRTMNEQFCDLFDQLCNSSHSNQIGLTIKFFPRTRHNTHINTFDDTTTNDCIRQIFLVEMKFFYPFFF